MYVSHVAEDGRVEEVATHLKEVAEMAAGFARGFGAEEWAYAVGMVHDIGKYSEEFQDRILRDGPKVDHSTAGAALLRQKDLKLLAYCAAGHHGGLPDGGAAGDEQGSTLIGRLQKAARGELHDCRAYASEVEEPEATPFSFGSTVALDNFSLSFLTRMIFSCLVDADFLCTERFMNGVPREPLTADSLETLLKLLEKKVQTFYPPRTRLNETRCAVLDECAQVSTEAPGVFSLTVPTGGGKTYASLYFALRHALADGHGMRRIVYVAPYTSIIEQNATVFREVLGERNVLEHHASFDFDDPSKDGGLLRLAAENWDAPVVVTTNVQLFESLFASKTSRCRKLHNIANSVIVLDEAQMLPTNQLLPCVRALAELVHRYGCTVVLCTATQPSLNGLFRTYGCEVREIVPDPKGLYERLRRVEYRYFGKLDDDELADRMVSHGQALCVVNSRRQAKALYDLIEEAVEGEGAFHLSTLMHPVHRESVLAEVRRRLKAGEACRVVSTSLIEAGVDVDFPAVYRALAGVDSMVQCAGRCNREGKRAAKESFVYLFDPATAYAVPSDTDQKRAIARSILQRLGDSSDADGMPCDIGSLDAIEAYFGELHELRRDRLDAESVLADLTEFGLVKASGRYIPSIPFDRAAARFRMIEDGSHPVIVPDPKIEEDLGRLREGKASRGAMRRLARYSVGLYDNDIRALRDAHAIRLLDGDTYELLDQSLYGKDTGLDASDAGGKGLFY